jgi:mannose-6-phosphate isomerase-like protein (cupin superfamily)
MNIKNISQAKQWFQVLQTGKKSQTALMTLSPGQSSGKEAEAHEKSEQVLVVLRGKVCAEIESKKQTMKRGDVVVIPAGTKHKFTNLGKSAAVTFNVYSPPEYG